MQDYYCPNYASCKLVNNKSFVTDLTSINHYIDSYCQKADSFWTKCKRYQFKLANNFCPDFVMPDTQLSTEEIINQFDELENE